MKKLSQEEKNIRQYLLGMLGAEQSELLEERFLTDADLVGEVAMIENEIVSDYVANTLSAQEKDQFESHFLSVPGRQQKLEFFVALRRNIASQPQPIGRTHLPTSWRQFLPAFLRGENPLLRYALTCIALALVLGGGLQLLQSWRTPRRGSDHSQLATHTVRLSPIHGRAIETGEIGRVYLSDSTEVVRLHLLLTESSYQSYRVALLTDERVEKFTWDGLGIQIAASEKVIDIGVPAELLTRGDYQLRLDGRTLDGDFESLDSYSFRVIRN